jgi:predicted Zn-dependent protease
LRKILSLTLLFFLLARGAFAESSLIRDAETEKFLRDLAEPIFEGADLNPQEVQLYIINDSSINAFVSGGRNIFINTGLIRRFQTPDALIGVIAHEVGHIAGGHLARSREGMKDAQNAMFLSYLLGIGAIASGSPEAGQALILGGSQTAQRLAAKYTRTQEEAADQYAIKYLEKMAYPPKGLINLLEIFAAEMVGYKGQIDEYLLSHPVSQRRIELLKERTKNWQFSGKQVNEKLQKLMTRVLVKLEAFIENPDETLKKYHNNYDENAIYAKSVALFRKGLIDRSLDLLEKVIIKNPQDGFLFELKGQILFESGRVKDAAVAYDRAIKLLDEKDSAMAKLAFGSAILALKTKDEVLLELAIKRLEEAKAYESRSPFLFYQLAIAYNKMLDEGRSLLALAEYNLLIDKKDKVGKIAKLAKEKLPPSAKEEQLRADDLIEMSKS